MFSNLCKIRAENDNLLHLDMHFEYELSETVLNKTIIKTAVQEYKSTSLLSEIDSYKKKITHDNGSISAINYTSPLFRFFRQLNIKLSIPSPKCSYCLNDCFNEIVICTHVIPELQTTFLRRSLRINNDAQNRKLKNDSVFVSPTCLNCKNKYKCIASRNSTDIQSISGCKSMIILSRFCFEEISLLLNLILMKYNEMNEKTPLKVLKVINKIPKCCDIVDLNINQRNINNQWNRTLEGITLPKLKPLLPKNNVVFKFSNADNIETFAYNPETELFKPPVLQLHSAYIRSQLSWLYLVMGIINNNENS